jgi:hypothetical protein
MVGILVLSIVAALFTTAVAAVMTDLSGWALLALYIGSGLLIMATLYAEMFILDAFRRRFIERKG